MLEYPPSHCLQILLSVCHLAAAHIVRAYARRRERAGLSILRKYDWFSVLHLYSLLSMLPAFYLDRWYLYHPYSAVGMAFCRGTASPNCR